MIDLLPTTSFYLKSSPLSSNRSIKLLYIARAISIYSTAGLLLQIGFLTIPIMPRLTFKNFTLNIATTKNIPILRQRPTRYRRSVRSTISLQIIAPYTILRRCFYQIRSGSSFTRDLIIIRIRRTSLVVILRIQRIAEFRAQQRTSSQRSIRASIVLPQLLSFYY